MFQKYQNPDGTYNGIAALADGSGLSIAEIKWTVGRIKCLMGDGMTKAEAIATIKMETVGKPWEVV